MTSSAFNNWTGHTTQLVLLCLREKTNMTASPVCWHRFAFVSGLNAFEGVSYYASQHITASCNQLGKQDLKNKTLNVMSIKAD